MRLMVRCAVLVATAMFVLTFYSRASGRAAVANVERTRHATALGMDLRATVDFEVVTRPTNEGCERVANR